MRNGDAGVFSLRRVRFPENFQSQIYPDDKLLDFVISFSRATTTGANTVSDFAIISATLINAYTIMDSQIINIKAAFVNFYGSPIEYNKGSRIPMFLRIGGSVLSSEHMGATMISIFFDESINANNFYENVVDYENKENFQIGCSATEC